MLSYTIRARVPDIEESIRKMGWRNLTPEEEARRQDAVRRTPASIVLELAYSLTVIICTLTVIICTYRYTFLENRMDDRRRRGLPARILLAAHAAAGICIPTLDGLAVRDYRNPAYVS